jgi:hypothetical protein
MAQDCLCGELSTGFVATGCWMVLRDNLDERERQSR